MRSSFFFWDNKIAKEITPVIITPTNVIIHSELVVNLKIASDAASEMG